MWGAENLRPGATVWLTENYIDAMLLMERHPDYVGLAVGGASIWRDEWTKVLADSKPGRVVVILDNDLAGQATGRTLAKLQAERTAKAKAAGRTLPPIYPAGPKLANRLRKAGISAHLFPWPVDSPAKADLGWLLMQGPTDAEDKNP